MKRPADSQTSVLTIIAYKYPDRPHYEWTGNMLIKTDDYVLVQGQAGRRLVHHTRGQTFTYATQSLEYYPLNAPFTVNIDFDAHGASYHCNVCLPPRLDGDILSFVDLDLDYVRNPVGTWQVVDRDEFLVNQRSFAYPARLIEQAEAALADLIKRVTEGRFPFDGFLARQVTRLSQSVSCPPYEEGRKMTQD